MASKEETSRPAGYNMGHRHSLTIETNPLHLLPSNIRRFSQADSGHPAPPVFSKFVARQQIPEAVAEKKDDDEKTDNKQ